MDDDVPVLDSGVLVSPSDDSVPYRTGVYTEISPSTCSVPLIPTFHSPSQLSKRTLS